MFEFLAQHLKHLIYQLQEVDTSAFVAFFLIASIIIVLDAVSMYARNKRKEVGLSDKHFKKGFLYPQANSLKSRLYVSNMQLLSGKPDALISENGFIIPIERKPFAKKIYDRYVVQLLVYMRLVEEFEGKKPPYGYLIIGKNCRQVKIHNTPEKQAWLQSMIDEMQGILNENKEAIPTPERNKCKNCHFKDYCDSSVCL